MNWITVPTKEVRAIVNATFPDYRKKTVNIRPATTVTFRDLNWSGGTRAQYRACTVTGKPLPSKVDMHGPAPWRNPLEGKEVEIPKGAVIVEGGSFCGKPSTLLINVHPDNMPKFLPDTNNDVSDHEKIVLSATRSLKNTYGGKTKIRFTESSRKYGITRQEWLDAKQSCIDKGLLRKNGAITPAGHNVDTGTFRVY